MVGHAMNSQRSSNGTAPRPLRIIRVVLADDSKFARSAIASVLGAYPWVRIAGQAENGTEAFALAARLEPDLVVTDLDMPGLDGFQLVRRLRESYPAMRSVIVSAHDTPALYELSVRHGADDFIPKGQLPDQFPCLSTRFFPDLAEAGIPKGEP